MGDWTCSFVLIHPLRPKIWLDTSILLAAQPMVIFAGKTDLHLIM